jgi:uncharacterized damage-inducible protein DinB
MSSLALTAENALAWNDATAKSWRRLTEAHPEVLTLECDIYSGVKTVGQLLQHIVAVETRYAERLSAARESQYDAIPYGTAAEIFDAHDSAFAILRDAVAQPIDWDETMDFQTLTMGRCRASRKTIFFHALLHSIRHYAQLATLIRKHGYKLDRPLDYLVMGLTRLD